MGRPQSPSPSVSLWQYAPFCNLFTTASRASSTVPRRLRRQCFSYTEISLPIIAISLSASVCISITSFLHHVRHSVAALPQRGLPQSLTSPNEKAFFQVRQSCSFVLFAHGTCGTTSPQEIRAASTRMEHRTLNIYAQTFPYHLNHAVAALPQRGRLVDYRHLHR